MDVTAMKTSLSLLLLSFSLSAFGQGVLLGPGDSFSYSFSTLNYAGDISGAGPRANFTAFFVGDLLDPGESVRLELFESSGFGSPVSSRNVTTLSTAQSKAEVLLTASYSWGLPWQDFEGAVRLTMLSGSARLGSVGAYTTRGTGLYSVLTPVPEPSSLTLLCVALVAGAAWRRKRQQARPGGR
jgi:hypothetical protein